MHHPDPVAPKAADDGRDRSGVVADHDQDPLQSGGEQGPHRPFDQAQATQPEQGLGGTPGERFQPLGPARSQHDTHPRRPRQRRGGASRARRLGGRGDRIRRKLRRGSHAPSALAARG
jgi:hypothetical protein